jgi:hypothetical protein
MNTITLLESVYEVRGEEKNWKVKTNANEVFYGNSKIFITDSKGGNVTVKEGEAYQGEDGTFVYWFYQGENK